MMTATMQPNKGLTLGLWMVQGLLTVAFLGAGLMKLSTPVEVLGQQMAWVLAVPAGLVKFIGLMEEERHP